MRPSIASGGGRPRGFFDLQAQEEIERGAQHDDRRQLADLVPGGGDSDVKPC